MVDFMKVTQYNHIPGIIVNVIILCNVCVLGE